MPDILHRIGIKASQEQVYGADRTGGSCGLVDEGDEGHAQLELFCNSGSAIKEEAPDRMIETPTFDPVIAVLAGT
ncbi:MAG TPA: hypothetical protein VL197_06910 [Nitrospirota bacterium]|nr:hypothetical protein [Nitrospirota bacterium]